MLAGFVLRAQISNKSAGENVNCNHGGTESNSKSKANFCKAVVAEVSPHQRPDDLNHGDIAETNSDPDDRHPVRLTGHLFYDGNHPVKCDTNNGANSRASKWEIHPVYAIDVCKNKSMASCDPRDNSKWTSLKDWIAAREADENH